VKAGRDALFAYSPMTRDRDDPDRIYRSLRFGKDLELFVLDARSYRDRNDAPDSPEREMLGEDQIEWLVEGLSRSTATWKVISSDVPISIPTGSVAAGRDGWANLGAEPTGFEQELGRLLCRLDAVNAKNVVFVATDVHFAQTIRYRTDADGDGDGDVLELHDAINGPLNAVRGAPGALDPFANPTSLYGEGGIFNFGFVRIARQADGKVNLVADARPHAAVARLIGPAGHRCARSAQRCPTRVDQSLVATASSGRRSRASPLRATTRPAAATATVTPIAVW
jgi:alkaline phosphatase D